MLDMLGVSCNRAVVIVLQYTNNLTLTLNLHIILFVHLAVQIYIKDISGSYVVLLMSIPKSIKVAHKKIHNTYFVLRRGLYGFVGVC